MGLDDGEWIRDEPAGDAGRADDRKPDAGQPDAGWPADEWPTDEWPTDGWPADGWPASTQPPRAGKRRGYGGVPGFSARVAILWGAVAVAAAPPGIPAGLFLARGTPAASPADGTPPSAPAWRGS